MKRELILNVIQISVAIMFEASIDGLSQKNILRGRLEASIHYRF